MDRIHWRIFLLGILNLINQGETVSCKEIEENLSNGIIEFLLKRYPEYFKDVHPDYHNSISDYYRGYVGVVEQNEERKYLCPEECGLSLLIALFLDTVN